MSFTTSVNAVFVFLKQVQLEELKELGASKPFGQSLEEDLHTKLYNFNIYIKYLSCTTNTYRFWLGVAHDYVGRVSETFSTRKISKSKRALQEKSTC